MTDISIYEIYEYYVDITYPFKAWNALERSLREIKENAMIMGTKCPECNLVCIPATVFCESCFATLGEYIEMPNKGKIVTDAISYNNMEGYGLKELEVVVFEGLTCQF